MRRLDRIVVKSVLMIAFHYPPMKGSSGIQRSLQFARHLPAHGWQPHVLSAHPRAYPSTSGDQLAEAGQVHRSFALDSGRHLALCGRYPAVLALPDRWISWWFSAVPTALGLIRRHRPSVIWSTFPIATAHLVGMALHRLTGIPWVADQRDPMTEDDYPTDPRTHAAYRWIETRTVRHGASVVCTTPGAVRALRTRYPDAPADRFVLIENGFEEESFSTARPAARSSPRFMLLHSGLVYPSERDPTCLFAALAQLRDGGAIGHTNFRLVLRASGHDAQLQAMLDSFGINTMVELAPPLPYHEALAEMLAADGLLLLQASNCNAQIPAKMYEYLRAARPVLALTDPAGDTAAALRACGAGTIASLDSTASIVHILPRFLAQASAGAAPLASAAMLASHSRAARGAELAKLFNRIVEPT